MSSIPNITNQASIDVHVHEHLIFEPLDEEACTHECDSPVCHQTATWVSSELATVPGFVLALCDEHMCHIVAHQRCEVAA
jgi:hypothetical protein